MQIKFKTKLLHFMCIFLVSITLSIRLINLLSYSSSIRYENKNQLYNFTYIDQDQENSLEIKHRPQTPKRKYIRYECVDANQKCGGWADRLKGKLFIFFESFKQLLSITFLF